MVADLHRALVDRELKNLQEALHASDKRRLSWRPAFVSVLILGIVTEVMQHLVRCKASSDISCTTLSMRSTYIYFKISAHVPEGEGKDLDLHEIDLHTYLRRLLTAFGAGFKKRGLYIYGHVQPKEKPWRPYIHARYGK